MSRSEVLLQRMNDILDGAEREGRKYLRSGEQSLYRSLEKQLAAEQEELERRMVRQQSDIIKQTVHLEQQEAELRERKATRRFFQTGDSLIGSVSSGQGQSVLELKVERRQLSSVVGSAGGYTVPAFVTDVIEAAQQEDQILFYSTVTVGDGRGPHYSPAFDDVANMSQLVAQNASYTSGPDLLFRRDEMDKKSYRSGIFLASVELVQDSAIDAVLTQALGKRAGRRLAFNLASGLANAQTVTSSASTTRNKLLDLMNGCRYAHNPGTFFMMHPSQLNQTILQNETAGLPTVENIGGFYYCFGKRVLLNPYLPSVQDSPTSSTVYFGLPSRLLTVTNTYRVSRFNERYAEMGMVGFELLFQSSDPVIAVGSATDYPVVQMSL